jgi:hypothetical protein
LNAAAITITSTTRIITTVRTTIHTSTLTSTSLLSSSSTASSTTPSSTSGLPPACTPVTGCAKPGTFLQGGQFVNSEVQGCRNRCTSGSFPSCVAYQVHFLPTIPIYECNLLSINAEDAVDPTMNCPTVQNYDLGCELSHTLPPFCTPATGCAKPGTIITALTTSTKSACQQFCTSGGSLNCLAYQVNILSNGDYNCVLLNAGASNAVDPTQSCANQKTYDMACSPPSPSCGITGCATPGPSFSQFVTSTVQECRDHCLASQGNQVSCNGYQVSFFDDDPHYLCSLLDKDVADAVTDNSCAGLKNYDVACPAPTET